MNSKNVVNYENVVIRKEQEVGINNFGLNYLVSLEQEIQRLNNIINELETYIDKMSYTSVVNNPKKDLVKILKRGDKE